MKKLIVVAAAILLFGCERTTRTDNEGTRDHTTEESMDAGSGTDISPQLKKSDTNATRLKVDTVSAPDAE